jgi:hypothetical protein
MGSLSFSSASSADVALVLVLVVGAFLGFARAFSTGGFLMTVFDFVGAFSEGVSSVGDAGFRVVRVARVVATRLAVDVGWVAGVVADELVAPTRVDSVVFGSATFLERVAIICLCLRLRDARAKVERDGDGWELSTKKALVPTASRKEGNSIIAMRPRKDS